MNARNLGLNRAAADERGSVSVIGAFSLVALIGMLGFSVDLAAAYSASTRNQRVADMAALAASEAYDKSGSTAQMQATAQSIALAAQLPNPIVTATALPSSTGVGQEVTVNVTTSEGVYFGRIFGAAATTPVNAVSVARVGAAMPACIIALSSTAMTGVLGTGGTSLNARDCAVASNSPIGAEGGAQMVAASFNTPRGTSTTGGATITTEPQANQINASSATDPLAGNTELSSAFAQISAPVVPPSLVTGQDFNPPYSGGYTHSGSTGSWNNSTNTWTFPAGSYSIRNLNVPGGMTLVFQGPATTVNVSGTVTIGGGSKLTIGDGKVVMLKGFSQSGGTIVTMGRGDKFFGRQSSSTVSILIAGGGIFRMGDGPFVADGAVRTSGGSTIVFGATANHVINGDLDLSGSSTFGAGRYTINGNFSNNTGGTMVGTDVSFVLAGQVILSGGTGLNLKAPATSSGGGIADVLIASRTAAETRIGGGSQNTYSGAFYVPNSHVNFSGGAGVTGGGGCFTLIGKTITLNGGAAGATSCPSVSGGAVGNRLARLIR